MAAATASPPIETFDMLHERLGGIPLSRIRMKPAPGDATEEDLLRAPKPICELIDGVLVEKAMGNRESQMGTYISALFTLHTKQNDLGAVGGEATFYRLAEGQLRAPDASFVPWSDFPDGEPPEGEAYWAVAPALAVEVLSPTNTRAEIDRKVSEYFEAGSKLVWVIDPDRKSAKVYTSAKRCKELDAKGTLDGGKVLPGFKLPLADLFASTKPRKKKPR
jgi:Uma2 family endonuclease